MKYFSLPQRKPAAKFNPKKYTRSMEPEMTPEYRKLAEDFMKRQQRIIRKHGQT